MLTHALIHIKPFRSAGASRTHEGPAGRSTRGARWERVGTVGRTWADHTPLAVSQGQRVELDIVNRSRMAPPMHLHGHHFQVVALNGQALSGAMHDTVLVPVNGRVRVAFDADNPGRWLFHCHNLYHMATGMMTEVAYAGFA